MMNRAQRRAMLNAAPQKQVQIPKSVQFTPKDVVKMQIHMELEEFKKKVLGDAVKQVTAAFVINLGEIYGFGKLRLTKLLKGVDETFAAVVDGTVDLNDLIREAGHFGIDLSKEKKDEEAADDDAG